MRDLRGPWPGVRFSPEALGMFCRDVGERPEQAVADAETLSAEMAASACTAVRDPCRSDLSQIEGATFGLAVGWATRAAS
jgi:hypothetical protein